MGARLFQLLAAVALIALVRYAFTQAMTQAVQSQGSTDLAVVHDPALQPYAWTDCSGANGAPVDPRCNTNTQAKGILPPQ